MRSSKKRTTRAWTPDGRLDGRWNVSPAGGPGSLLSALAALLLVPGTAAAQSADGAVERSPVLDAARAVAGLDAPVDPGVAPAPDDRFIAALQPRPDPIIWIVPTDGSAPFPLREGWAAFRLRWSPSGDRIGFIAAVGPPRVWTIELDPRTGQPRAPPRMLIRTSANAYAFAPDGRRIALVTSRSTAAGASEIRIVDWATRDWRTLARESGPVYRLDWSPDGRWLYYGVDPAADDPDHRIRRVDVATGSTTTVRRTGSYLGLSPDGRRILYTPSSGPRAPGATSAAPARSASQETARGSRRRTDGTTDREPGTAARFAIADVDGGPARVFQLPVDSGMPRWSGDGAALLAVRPRDDGHAILRIPIAPGAAPTEN